LKESKRESKEEVVSQNEMMGSQPEENDVTLMRD
jgi:hypothetical protein